MPLHFDRHKPKTLDEAVEAIWSDLDETERAALRRTAPAAIHGTVGQTMRNSWDLWRGDSPMRTFFAEAHGLGHADDLSGMILRALFCRARDEEFDAEAAAKRYRDFWTRQGTDPLTQKRIR